MALTPSTRIRRVTFRSNNFYQLTYCHYSLASLASLKIKAEICTDVSNMETFNVGMAEEVMRWGVPSVRACMSLSWMRTRPALICCSNLCLLFSVCGAVKGSLPVTIAYTITPLINGNKNTLNGLRGMESIHQRNISKSNAKIRYAERMHCRLFSPDVVYGLSMLGTYVKNFCLHPLFTANLCTCCSECTWYYHTHTRITTAWLLIQ